MSDKPSKEQLNKDIEQFRKDLKDLSKKIEMIGKRNLVGKDMAPDILNALLIKEPFVLSSPLKEKNGKEKSNMAYSYCMSHSFILSMFIIK